MEPEMDKTEKRRFQRFSFDADAILRRNGQEWTSKLLDICLNGILLITPEGWEASLHDSFEIEIIFANSESLIYATVSLAHSEKGRVGFKVDNIDLDSISHLRRLVELNLGNSDLLDRELAHLIWG